MTQAQALDILKTGSSVFLTGEPGSGKTHTVNAYISWLRSHDISVAVTASTGIAATHIGGRTVHSFAGIGIKTALTAQDVLRIAKNDRVAKRIRAISVLVIDEISMLSARTLGMIEQVCRAVRQSDLPFGGLQAVLVGDFFQLPPVVRQDTGAVRQSTFLQDRTDSLFCFYSSAWERLDPVVCYIAEQHRQEDAAFLDVLSALRRGAVLDTHHALLRTRFANVAKPGMTQLFPHNAQVDAINEMELNRLPGDVRRFEMASSGPKELVDQLKKGCLSPDVLSLKIGARVMFTKNDVAGRFVNGSLGVVEGFADGEDDGGYPIVRLGNGRRVNAEPLEWAVDEGFITSARIIQIPLRLAWAITVHKSQGMSLDAAHMDLSRVFEFGQGYVALSRVRTLAGLSLAGINERACEVHPDILKKDGEFRELSNNIREYASGLRVEELSRKHHEFIVRCGGKAKQMPKADESNTKWKQVDPQDASKAYSVNTIREQHSNAYRPWSEEEEKILRELFESGEKIKNIAKKLGRQHGAISSRLKKLREREEATA
ncbi:AAA family ATPase [Candidatus Uhrbacteria bacterium]|nr:AAA family ATPase [Candidatus Uhrbacteria bacterium]